MARRSKSIDKFMKSLDEYVFANDIGYTLRQKVRVFDDDLFIFYEASGGRLRKSADDYRVIGGRSAHKGLSGSRLLADVLSLTKAERRGLCSCLDSGRQFAVISAGEQTALIYCGLLGSCGLGVASLTAYHPRLINRIKGEEFGHLLVGTWLSSECADDGGTDDPGEFIAKIQSFENELLSVCGKEPADVGIGDMIASAARLVGCGLRLGDTLRISAEAINRDTLAAMLLCIFSAVRSAATDRTATVRCGTVDGETVITVKFRTQPSFMEGNTVFIDFCRAFAEHYLIPFAFELTDINGWVSFIPYRLDPSASGLKTSIIFDAEREEFTVKRCFDDAR